MGIELEVIYFTPFDGFEFKIVEKHVVSLALRLCCTTQAVVSRSPVTERGLRIKTTFF